MQKFSEHRRSESVIDKKKWRRTHEDLLPYTITSSAASVQKYDLLIFFKKDFKITSPLMFIKILYFKPIIYLNKDMHFYFIIFFIKSNFADFVQYGMKSS